MRKIFEAADGQPDADDVCFVSNGCTALQIAALYPPLTEQEEQKLLSTRGTPDWESARERLVLCNLRLVMWVANRYPESGGFTRSDRIRDCRTDAWDRPVSGIAGNEIIHLRHPVDPENDPGTGHVATGVNYRTGPYGRTGCQVTKRTAPNDRGRHPGTVHGRTDDKERNRSVHVGTVAIRHGSVHVRVFGYASGVRQFARLIRYRGNGRRFHCGSKKEHRRNSDQ